MPTYTYREVSHREQRRVPCTGCGKKLTRARTFTQTINPWNRNASGTPKTYAEIMPELRAEGAKWQPTAMCKTCDPPPPPPPIEYIQVNTTGGEFDVVRTRDPAEAREKAVALIRKEIAEAERRIAVADQWTYRCWPTRECRHGDGPCFPASPEGDSPTGGPS